MPEVFYTADFGSALAVSILLAAAIFGGEWVLKSYLKKLYRKERGICDGTNHIKN